MITSEDNAVDSIENESTNSKDDLTQSFEVILKDLPEVLQYIKRLNEHIHKQQTTIVKLFEKLKEFKSKSNNTASIGTQTEDNYSSSWSETAYEESQAIVWNTTAADGTGKSLADEIKQAAESAMQQTGFVYEESSGLYYDYNTGYYYNSELGLYYDGTSGTYVYYNEETNQFEYHSQASFPTLSSNTHETNSGECSTSANIPGESTLNASQSVPQSKSSTEKSKLLDGKRSLKEESSERKRRRKRSPTDGQESPEDGELFDSDSSNDESDQPTRPPSLHEKVIKQKSEEKEQDSPPPSPPDEISSRSSRFPDNSELANAWPPCIRVIVQKTSLPNLKIGALFIVTCTGGTLGREGEHTVSVPDINISKHHAKFTFDNSDGKYYITDLGSRNGTILDGQRLSVAKQESEPHEIKHGSKLQLGSTILLCHVHGGNETCGHCEPGLVAGFADAVKADNGVTVPSKPVGNQHKEELRRLRRKFGLTNSEAAAEMTGAACPAGYEDRAHTRRQAAGSLDDNVKTEIASIDQHIKSSNKGFKMLAKMGWSLGQTLGKEGNTAGSTEPITLIQRPDKAGLGMDLESLPPEVDVKTKRKADVWRKTQQRYSELSADSEPTDETVD